MGNQMGVSSMMLLQLLEPMVFIVPILLWLVVIGPLVLYPLARWKAHREPHVDTQLGLKVALHYFRMIAFQLLLLGALVVIWTVIRKGDGKGDFYRVGFGLLLPAGLVFGGAGCSLATTCSSPGSSVSSHWCSRSRRYSRRARREMKDACATPQCSCTAAHGPAAPGTSSG
jgi:hypothetical protein